MHRVVILSRSGSEPDIAARARFQHKREIFTGHQAFHLLRIGGPGGAERIARNLQGERGFRRMVDRNR